MGLFKSLSLIAPLLSALVTSTPTPFQPRSEAVNYPREFYISLKAFVGPTKYDGYVLEAYHTGAGLADPVFVKSSAESPGTKAFLNGTNLQFDIGSDLPFSASGLPFDTNYARWEPVTIAAGYGSGEWIINGEGNLAIGGEYAASSDGWLACEWVHSFDLPQLFQLIKSFDSGPGYTANDIPSSCSRVVLQVHYI